MADVLEIARARCDALRTEIHHLEAFIRMGEKLARKEAQASPPQALGTATADPARA